MLATAPTSEPIPDSSSLKITIPVQGAVTKAAYSRAASDIAKTRSIPGWRPQDSAKIPAGIVAIEVGKELIISKAIEELSESEVHSAISALGLTSVVGQAQLMETPEAMIVNYKPGEPFELVVKIDVWPEATFVSPWDDGTMEVEVERTARDETVRVKAMEALRERYVDKVDTPEGYEAQPGDMVLVDMRGYERDPATAAELGPLPVQGVGGDALELKLETGKFLPGVVEALIGCKEGETKIVNVDFPGEKSYRDNQPLAGLMAGFEITVKNVKTLALPNLDDAFAEKIRKGLTLNELEKEVENTVGSQEQGQDDDRLYLSLERALADRAQCPLPDSVVTESARQKFAIMLADMRSNGVDDSTLKQMISPEGFEKYKKVVRPVVERELRGRLAIEAVAKQALITVDDALLAEQMELVKRQYEQQQKETETNSSFDEDKAREKVTDELLRVKVLDHVKSFAKVKYVDPPPAPSTADTSEALAGMITDPSELP